MSHDRPDPNESTLTPSNVASTTFGLLRTLPVDGKVDGQSLYLSGLSIGGQSHNVVYAVSEHDSVYAFDADTGTQLWKTSILGTGKTPVAIMGVDRSRLRSGSHPRR